MGNSINNIKFLGRKFFGVRNLNITPVYDPDAQAYFNANTTITSAADKNAINTFYLGLKSDGVYTKIKAMYLPIWGSAAACKWNLVNPLDTNAAFRLIFTTGWTFSSSGMTPLNAYSDTFLIPSIILTLNSAHISYYSRTSASGSYDMGSQIVGAGLTLGIRDAGYTFIRVNTYGAGTESNILNADGKGFYQANRNLSNIQSIIKNNTINNFSVNSVSRPTNNIFIGAINNPIIYYGNKQCSFASIGDGLTDTEASNFYTRVNTLMTYFGINV